MSYLSFIKKSLAADISTIYHDIFDKKDRDELKATGSQIYHGRQRQGKTLGMMHHYHAIKRRYPRLLTISNVHIRYLIVYKEKKFFRFFTIKKPEKMPLTENIVVTKQDLEKITSLEAFKSGLWQRSNYIYYQTYDSLLMLLRTARNGKYGTHFMIDEIHQYFHSHDSKSMPVWVSQIFSQQMKQYILVTGTVQKWENVIKALREQIQNLILSSRIGWLITQTVIDPEDIETDYGEQTAPIKKKGYFFMTKLVRESFDTYALIESGREIFGGTENSNIYISTEKQKPKNKSKYATFS